MKRYASVLVLIAYLMSLACQSFQEIPPSEVRENDRILAATYPSGKVVEFQDQVPSERKPSDRRRTTGTGMKPSGAKLAVATETVDGITKDGQAVSIPVAALTQVRVQRFSMGKTALFLGCVAFAFVAFALIFAETESVTQTDLTPPP